MEMIMIGGISLLFGFLSGYTITRERLNYLRWLEIERLKLEEIVLRKRHELEFKKSIKKKYLENLSYIKRNSRLRFSNKVMYRTLPFISSNSLSNLWYQSDDYRKFKLEFKKQSSI
tara:strand:+ start:39 stop:386 length:348 start_codon:yes stop_codon:yes gene_type:complete